LHAYQKGATGIGQVVIRIRNRGIAFAPKHGFGADFEMEKNQVKREKDEEREYFRETESSSYEYERVKNAL
jgi:hypothetical protein